MTAELEMPLRCCTVCNALGIRRDAIHVGVLPDGTPHPLQWFECDHHQPEDHGRVFGEDTSRRELIPLVLFLQAAREPRP
jgi:hypothetical protein